MSRYSSPRQPTMDSYTQTQSKDPACVSTMLAVKSVPTKEKTEEKRRKETSPLSARRAVVKACDSSGGLRVFDHSLVTTLAQRALTRTCILGRSFNSVPMCSNLFAAVQLYCHLYIPLLTLSVLIRYPPLTIIASNYPFPSPLHLILSSFY